jgi:ParB family chromosome partitioning protein
LQLENSSSVFEELKISAIEKPAYSVRASEDGNLDLAASIMRQGLLQPIIVRPGEGKFELVAGSRRLAACKTLGWRKIPCQIVDLTDKESFEVALSENVARKSLDPLEEAKAFHDYVERFGWGSEKELACKIGRSPAYVSKRLGLLELPAESLQRLFRRRKNPSLAEEILAEQDMELRNYLLNVSAEQNLTGKEVRRLRRDLERGAGEREVPWPERSEGDYEQRSRVVKSSIRRTVTALRVALNRLDEVIENIDDENWILKEVLLEQRTVLHSQIDLVYNLTRRLEKMFPPGYEH